MWFLGAIYGHLLPRYEISVLIMSIRLGSAVNVQDCKNWAASRGERQEVF